MAIVLDVNLLVKEMLNIEVIEDILKSYSVRIDSISMIDNWEWENEQRIKEWKQIKEAIDNKKVIIFRLFSFVFKDLGLYIEKVKDLYLYNFWINTKGYSQLDSDGVTSENKLYYEEIYQSILRMEKKKPNIIKVAGIGLETDFYCSDKIEETVQKSQNIIAWLFNSEFEEKGTLLGYIKKNICNTNMSIFEKTG